VTIRAPDMMSSVIPARLEFQCGHAALVSLPRIKHESSAQRIERVAREKSDALGRRCDFCGPLVAEVVAVAAPQVAPVRINGANGHQKLADVAAVPVARESRDGHAPKPVRPVAVPPAAAPEAAVSAVAATEATKPVL